MPIPLKLFGFNIVYKRDLTTFIFCLIIVFLILSFLEIRAERRKKLINVEFSFATFLILNIYIVKHYPFEIMLLKEVWVCSYA